MEKIEIGKIVKEQGIKGDVKMIVFADTDFNLKNLKTVYINQLQAQIERVYNLNGGIGVKFDIIDSRNTASLYKNAIVYANKQDLACKEDRFFIADLLNKSVELTTGEQIGNLIDVQNFGSADIFYITNCGKQVLVSHIQGLIESVSDQKIILNANKFRQVAVYED